MSALTREERLHWQSWIAMALCNLRHALIFWVPNERRFAARSPIAADPFASSVGRKALPKNAILVGEYAHGIKASSVLDDLEDAISSGA